MNELDYRLKATPDSRDYTLIRNVDAPVAEVWQDWVDPDHLRHWLSPKDLEVLEVSVDFRVDGAWKTRMRSSDGSEHTTHGVYIEIAEPVRLIMTQTWKDSEEQSEITVLLAAKGDGTKVMVEHRRFESGESTDCYAEEWNESLGLPPER